MTGGAVFLDRDGVVLELVSHLCHPDQVVLLPRAAEAIRLLNRSGLRVVILTNQSVVARGLCTEDELADIHAVLMERLCQASVDRIYYCPHYPPGLLDGGRLEYQVACDCRKPGTGLFERAARELRIKLSASVFVGDMTSDVEAARRANMPCFLTRTGYGGSDRRYNAAPLAVVDDLYEAALRISGTHAARVT